MPIQNRVSAFKISPPTIVLIILLIIFAISAAFFAINLRTGIVPDEIEHVFWSNHFATTWGLPENTPETYVNGPVARKPVLYYWLNGRIINLLGLIKVGGDAIVTLVVLRLVSVFYSLLTVIVVYLAARELIESPWWRLFVVFCLTNTLMFIFLSGGVSYDNLTNLLSAASLYFLIRVFNNKPFYTNSLGWLIVTCIGTLAKITVLPVAAISGLAWLWFIFRQRANIEFPPRWNKTLALLSVAALILITMNLAYYGWNLLKYHTLQPKCNQILTDEQCLQDKFNIRAQTINLPQKLSLLDVYKQGYPDPAEWFMDTWSVLMLRMIYGIFGHKAYIPDVIITVYRLLFAWWLVVILRTIKKPTYVTGALLVNISFYTAVLMAKNYNAELTTGFQHIGIQGRYIFPVIGPIYLLMGYYLASFPHTRLRRATALAAILVFLWGTWVSPLFTMLNNPLQQVRLPDISVKSEQTLPELTGKTQISQTFKSQCRGTLQNVELKFATFDRKNTHPVNINLVDAATKQVIAAQVLPASSLQDNKWFAVPLPPLKNTFTNAYRITITSPESTPGDAISLWASASDTYKEGQALLNGKATSQDIAFQYRCTQHNPKYGTDWFR